MAEESFYVVYPDGMKGGYPYGVFTSKDTADAARERIIKHLESTEREILDDGFIELGQKLTGSMDEMINIEECKLHGQFADLVPQPDQGGFTVVTAR
jgi:hypothetical protein